MKLRTSFFNAAALRKNLARFAPAWGIYGLLMLLVVINGSDLTEKAFASDMGNTVPFMAILNFFYALLCAQLLFGDLYNSRMCNALHAMPMRREGWFLTNAASGLLFALIPYGAVAVVAEMLCGEFWMFPLLWLCAMTMQFLFFFGVAVLSGYLVGHRFAMGLVYIILNGFSIIAYWLVYSIFEPMLYGVTIRQELFLDFCPVVKLCTFSYMEIYTQGIHSYWKIVDGWGYLGICAGVGIVAMAVGLLLYRKRNLETAGDFAAVKFVGPVFLVLYTICGGACCHGFFSLFLGDENEIFLFLGLAIGYFTGSMLLQRTVRVFKPKAFLGLGAVALAMILSVIVVRTDLLGIVRWMPQAEQIKSVGITTGGTTDYRNRQLTLMEAEDLEKILQIHQYGLENRNASNNNVRDVRVMLSYTLKSGIVKEREYSVDVTDPCGKIIREYMSRPEIVLGNVYTNRDSYALVRAEIYDANVLITDQEMLQQLMDAILADCEESTLPQDWGLTGNYGEHYWLSLEFYSKDGLHYYTEIRFTSESKHLTAWMKEQNIQSEKYN